MSIRVADEHRTDAIAECIAARTSKARNRHRDVCLQCIACTFSHSFSYRSADRAKLG